MQAQVRRVDGLILAVGGFPSGSSDPNVDIVEMTPAQIGRLSEPGQKVLNADGTITVTPPAPPEIVYAGEQTLTSRVTTSGTTPAELFRRTLAALTVYTALVELVGIDSGNGSVRMIRATIVAKRLTGGAILVPTATAQTAAVLADHRDGAAGAWSVVPSVVGSDVVITVAGAAGRPVDWFCRLKIDSFTPGGQTP